MTPLVVDDTVCIRVIDDKAGHRWAERPDKKI
jgi:hypothetical protein